MSRYVRSLPLDALVCDACTKFVKRNTGKVDVRKPSQLCMVSNCKQQARGTTTIATHSIASQYLELGQCSLVDESDKSLALCNSHYQKLYRELEHHVPLVEYKADTVNIMCVGAQTLQSLPAICRQLQALVVHSLIIVGCARHATSLIHRF